jgi:type I restriction enzyme S subunit
MKRYLVYKDSGLPWLGEIPEHWELTSIRGITKSVNRRNQPNLPLLAVYRDYGVIFRDARDDNHNVIPEDLSNYKLVEPGNLVLNKMKTWQGSLGVSEYRGIVSPAYIVCEVTAKVEQKFLNYLLRCHRYVFAYNTISYGVRVDQWDMRYEDFKQIPIFIPPLEEQKAIAQFINRKLAQINQFICYKRRLIELLNEQKTALINRAVTKGLDPDIPMKPSGIEWLGEIPRHWDVAPLYTRYSVQLGKMLNQDAVQGIAPAPYLRNANVQWDAIDFTDLFQMDFDLQERKKYELLVGDLLVCEGGEVGRTAIWNGELRECYFQKTLHRLRPLKCYDNSRFLFYVLYAATKIGVFTANVNKSTIGHLTAEKLKKYCFVFPLWSEQKQIINYLDTETAKFDQAIAQAEKEIELIQEYRTTLISDAVTGKIDVRDTLERGAALVAGGV